MTFSFIHAADIHLGNQQYGSPERYDDFGRALYTLVTDAVARRVDAVLLAGDLFHKRIIEPQTLLQATHCLGLLREAGVRAIAVEGNHERAQFTESLSWLDYLCNEGLLVLLTPAIRDGRPVMEPWDPVTLKGGYLDLPGGVRVYGCKYYGASMPRVARDLPGALANVPGPRPAFSVLLLHAGLQGVLNIPDASLTPADLAGLRPFVDYLALGHLHKPYSQDNWIHNPGSLETNSVDEAAWEDRGYLLVDVDTARQPAHRVTPIHNARRPFVRLRFAVDGIPTPADLHFRLRKYVASRVDEPARHKRPVVELTLDGVLSFDGAELDIDAIEEMVRDIWDPVFVFVRNETVRRDLEIKPPLVGSREELERFVIRQLVERDERRRHASDDWADLVLRLKEQSLAVSPPSDIVASLRAFRQQYQARTGEEEPPC